MKGLIKAGLACFLFVGNIAYGQSIYSFQGLGSLNHQGMPNNVGSGELGIGAPTRWHVNTQNPANLVFNRFSSFQVGVQAEGRNYEGENISGSDFDGGMRFLAYAFPIKSGKWSSSFGILPLSTVSYNTFTTGIVEGTTEVFKTINDKGEGGLTNFFWAHGFNLFPGFNLGIRANYTFGSINKESRASIAGEDVVATVINFIDQTSYSDINFTFGAGYTRDIKNERFLNFGVTLSTKSTLDGKNTRELTRLTGTGGVIEIREIDDASRALDLPKKLGFGVSFRKSNSHMFGIDFETESWANSSNSLNTFRNQTKIVLGGEWTPDYGDVNSYFRRATYRLGFNYIETPYIVNNETINDFGINFGASLPVSGFSSLDMAVKIGQLGSTSNGLIKESYYRIVLGATINDRWFIKRRYD